MLEPNKRCGRWELGGGIQGWKYHLPSNYVKSSVVILGVTTKKREIDCIPFGTADIPDEIRLTSSVRGILRGDEEKRIPELPVRSVKDLGLSQRLLRSLVASCPVLSESMGLLSFIWVRNKRFWYSHPASSMSVIHELGFPLCPKSQEMPILMW